MTAMSNLTDKLLGEILSRAPLRSLKSMRLTCKKWNTLSKTRVFCKASAARTQFPGLITIGSKVFSIVLEGIEKDKCFVFPTIKQVSKLDQVEISYVFHCDGLLLCVTKDKNKNLMVWNPYLGKTKWIQRPRDKFETMDMYALGYNNNRCNHKILRLTDYDYELYDFNSNSWRVLDVKSKWNIYQRGVSLKGNTYFLASEKTFEKTIDCLLYFDFTSERFEPSLPLPLNSYFHVPGTVTVLSCVKLRDDQLAVLYYQHEYGMEIYITTKIEPNDVSWSMFLNVSMTRLNGFPNEFVAFFEVVSFFIEEEKKMVVISGNARSLETTECRCPTGCIIREGRFFKYVNLTEPHQHREKLPHNYECTDQHLFSSYVPSLVTPNQTTVKERKRLLTCFIYDNSHVPLVFRSFIYFHVLLNK